MDFLMLEEILDKFFLYHSNLDIIYIYYLCPILYLSKSNQVLLFRHHIVKKQYTYKIFFKH